MFKDKYKAIAEKTAPDEKLIQSVLKRAEARPKLAERAISLRRRLVPAAAAALAVAVALTALLIPRGAEHSFILTASAAENTPLREDSYVEIGALKWDGGGYSSTHVNDEILADISVSGEDIESITYSMNRGKIGMRDEGGRLIDCTGKTDRVYDNEGNSFSVEGFSYYDSVTCSYDDPFTPEDNMLFTVSGKVGDDFDAATVLRYIGVKQKLSDCELNLTEQTLTADKVYTATRDYFNEVLSGARMYVTVTYTDGVRETHELSFTADCEVTPVHRVFHAYDYDENGEPYVVTDTLEDVYAFETRDDLDWNDNEDYNRVKHLFNDDNAIEFDDFETDVCVMAKIEK